MKKPIERREDGSIIRRPKMTTLEVVVRVRVEQDGIDHNRVAFSLSPGIDTWRGVTRKQAQKIIARRLKRLILGT